jgi:hypothetical protein
MAVQSDDTLGDWNARLLARLSEGGARALRNGFSERDGSGALDISPDTVPNVRKLSIIGGGNHDSKMDRLRKVERVEKTCR